MGTYYEFFAGGGMARAGLGTDWQCLFANDISAKKGDAYRVNWGNDHLCVGDVFDVHEKICRGRRTLHEAPFPAKTSLSQATAKVSTATVAAPFGASGRSSVSST